MNKDSLIIWWYYWTSSIIKVIEGIVVLITFGLVKISWVARYMEARDTYMLETRLKDISKWLENNPNYLDSL